MNHHGASRRLVLALALALVTTPVLAAQRSYLIGLTAAQCDTVVANALSDPARVDTLGLVRNCPGAFGPTMATLVERTSLVTSDFLTYSRIVNLSSQFLESDVFAAALDVAGNGSAPELARDGGLLILESMTTPGGRTPFLERYVGYSGAGGCIAVARDLNAQLLPGESPLPSDAAATVLSLANAIQSSAAPASVKFIASCLHIELSPIWFGTSLPEPPFVPADFSYVRQCGRKFLLRNASYAPALIVLGWMDSGTVRTKVFVMPPRERPSAYSESVWTVPGTGTTAFVSRGETKLMQETPNNTGC